MDTRELKIRKILAIALAATVAALGITALSAQTTLAESDDDNDDKRPEITVEVVEDIPAEEFISDSSCGKHKEYSRSLDTGSSGLSICGIYYFRDETQKRPQT